MTIIKDYGETYAALPTAQDEYVFSRISAGGQIEDFVLCDVFFDALLMAAQPDPDGWHGILLEYHCNMEWLEAEPWTINDLSAFINTLKSIPNKDIHQQPFGDQALAILPELLTFLTNSHEYNKVVIISKR